MDKFRYTLTSIITGRKDSTNNIGKNDFDKMKAHLLKKVHNTKNSDYWETHKNSGLFRESKYYFEFKSKNSYVLQILTVREAEEGCYFI